jgi:S-(hydroxymethyl)glutathione dehydrogenase / alcohol dehydrogenase
VNLYPALVLAALGQVPTIEMVSVSPPGANEVLVRIMAAGVCHTDLAAVRDARVCPVVLGHEGAGVVEAVGDEVVSPRPGDHVVINWQPKCGRCRHCLNGRRDLCEDVRGTSAPRVALRGQPLAVMLNVGCFCPYVVVPAQGAVAVRRDISFEKAALLGCSVATGVGAVLYTARVAPRETVVIIGAGGVGLNVVQGARLSGASQVIAIDRDEQRLVVASQIGATRCVNSDAVDPVAAVRELTGGRGADHVFEVVGRPELMAAGIDMLARGGSLTLVGAAGRDEVLSMRPRSFMSKQQRVQGCIYGNVTPERDLPMFADWYMDGRLQLDLLGTHAVPLMDVPKLFAPNYDHGGLRAIVAMGS